MREDLFAYPASLKPLPWNADQVKAIDMLGIVLEEFQKEKRMIDNDPEIIDVKTFTEVPEEFFSKEKDKTNNAAANTGVYNYGNMYNSNNCGYQSNDWQEKEAKRKKQKALEDKLRQIPTLIKRKDVQLLPELKILNRMKRKIAAIASGDYEFKLIDPDPKDTFEDEKKSSIAK